MTPMYHKLTDLLTQAFHPTYLHIVNESHLHQKPGHDTHFKIIIVSLIFKEIPEIQRHRMVYSTIGDCMDSIHAVSLKLLTPNEWRDHETLSFKSPSCQHQQSTDNKQPL
ncbi:MAG: BolA family transcriptional regulator [Endozoicomonadaceae bacterium]|nr:BolA family transcriptional regulator [Endozoicomonadaceae bacterium]